MRASIHVVLATALATIAAPSANAGEDVGPYGVDFHISAPSYAGCGARADAAATCATQNPNGVVASGAMWVWVFVSGVPGDPGAGAPDGIGSLSFGLSYDALGFASWSGCHGGDEDPQNDKGGTWPESGTGLAVSWPDECYRVTENDDGLTVVGILTVGTDETGLIDIIADPRRGTVHASDCLGAGYVVCADRLGRADVAAGGTGGVVACDETCTMVPTRPGSWATIKSAYRR